MNDKLLSLEGYLRSKIRGQDHVIPRICSVIENGQYGLNAADKPKGTLLFLGPSGVGKTESAVSFTQHLFGLDKFFRFNMSEYMHRDGIKLLLGDETGYRGRLGEVLAKHTHGTLLFDEMEKADIKILDAFLHILEPGEITVGRGEYHSLKDFFIVMTSNIGGEEVMRMSNLPPTTIERTVIEVLHEQLRPELINRFQDKIVFGKLSFEAQTEIAQMSLGEEVKRLSEMGFQIEPTAAALEFLIRHGIDKSLGARPMKRTVSKYIQDAARFMLKAGLPPSGKLAVDSSGNSLVISNRK